MHVQKRHSNIARTAGQGEACGKLIFRCGFLCGVNHAVRERVASRSVWRNAIPQSRVDTFDVELMEPKGGERVASYSDWRPYTEADVSANAPTTAGVYMLRVKLKDGGWQIRYVGQARNLRDRLLDHLSANEPNECLREHQRYVMQYCWIEKSSQHDRDFEESAKIKKYQPECNIQGK